MRTMIDLGKERGPMFGTGRMHIMDTPTSIDCMSLREAGVFRRTSFYRSLLDCVIPACCSAGFQSLDDSHHTSSSSSSSSLFGADSQTTSIPLPRDLQTISSSLESSTNSATTVTGTFFGNRKGRVSFSLQVHQQDHDFAAAATRRSRRGRPSTTPPPPPPVLLLLLEFGVPISYLAREMQHGLLRIALVEQGGGSGHQKPSTIFGVPTWSMYCNGRKVGYASRRETTASDDAILKLMQSVSVGAGVLPPQTSTSKDEIMYLRASFKRVAGSPDSESFHMINPDSDSKSSPYSSTSSSGQELSIFLLRSST